MWNTRQTRATPYAVVQRQRLLPEPGEVLVSAGDSVQAKDVVARLSLPRGLQVLDVGQALRVREGGIAPYL
ncbi:MAG: hypothetical protein GX605_02695, partial [Chloroflexi bacterium]|nr:hypothetical protein [Chloroflexota bacterium]